MNELMNERRDQKIALFPNFTERSAKNRLQAQGTARGRGGSSAGSGTGHRVLESPDARGSGETRRSGPGQKVPLFTAASRERGWGDGSAPRGLSPGLPRGRKADGGLVVQGCRKRFLQPGYATGSPYIPMCNLQTCPGLTVVPTAFFWCSSSFARYSPTRLFAALSSRNSSPAARRGRRELGRGRRREERGDRRERFPRTKFRDLHPTEDGRQSPSVRANALGGTQ